MDTPSHPDFSDLSAKAEAAVASVKDPELRKIAYQRVLDRLLAESSALPSPGSVTSPAAAKQPRQLTAPSHKRNFLLPAAFGLLAATLAAIPRVPVFLSLLAAAAEGRASTLALRGYEIDMAVHFVGNTIIWFILAALVVRYIPSGFTIILVLDIVAASLLLMAIILTAVPSLTGLSASGYRSVEIAPAQSRPIQPTVPASFPTSSPAPSWLRAMAAAPQNAFTWRDARDQASQLVGAQITVCGPVYEGWPPSSEGGAALLLVERPDLYQLPFPVAIATNVWNLLPQPPQVYYRGRVICATGEVAPNAPPREDRFHLEVTTSPGVWELRAP